MLLSMTMPANIHLWVGHMRSIKFLIKYWKQLQYYDINSQHLTSVWGQLQIVPSNICFWHLKGHLWFKDIVRAWRMWAWCRATVDLALSQTPHSGGPGCAVSRCQSTTIHYSQVTYRVLYFLLKNIEVIAKVRNVSLFCTALDRVEVLVCWKHFSFILQMTDVCLLSWALHAQLGWKMLCKNAWFWLAMDEGVWNKGRGGTGIVGGRLE